MRYIIVPHFLSGQILTPVSPHISQETLQKPKNNSSAAQLISEYSSPGHTAPAILNPAPVMMFPPTMGVGRGIGGRNKGVGPIVGRVAFGGGPVRMGVPLPNTNTS